MAYLGFAVGAAYIGVLGFTVGALAAYVEDRARIVRLCFVGLTVAWVGLEVAAWMGTLQMAGYW